VVQGEGAALAGGGWEDAERELPARWEERGELGTEMACPGSHARLV